jgi:uncharacterized membrane protein
MAALGPVQIIVLGFEGERLGGEILDQLRALRRNDAVRLVDLLFVTKDDAGNVVPTNHNGLTAEEKAQFGAMADALIGWSAAEDGLVAGAMLGDPPGEAPPEDRLFGVPDEWFIADGIPDGGSAAVVLVEHRWAVPVRDAIDRVGGVSATDHFVEPGDLAVLGLARRRPPMLP